MASKPKARRFRVCQDFLVFEHPPNSIGVSIIVLSKDAKPYLFKKGGRMTLSHREPILGVSFSYKIEEAGGARITKDTLGALLREKAVREISKKGRKKKKQKTSQ